MLPELVDGPLPDCGRSNASYVPVTYLAAICLSVSRMVYEIPDRLEDSLSIKMPIWILRFGRRKRHLRDPPIDG
jgi:hypothetical protein